MKGVGELSNGRICQLPQNVIHNILMLLPIKDAARTAIMSTNWRGHWRSVPQLVFRNGFAQISGPGMMNKLILNIYQSLLLHDGPVTKFVLAIPGLTSCDGIDHIIVHLSGRGIQELTFVFSKGFVMYKLPSSLFTAPLLNRLELENCLLMAPTWFVGFSKLTCLFLQEVSLPSDFFESFLPKCPMIKSLKMVSCTGPTNLELDAPRLEVFIFFGNLQKLCFMHTPLLSELILLVNRLESPEFVDLLASTQVLQRLYVSSEVLEVIAKGGEVPMTLPLHNLTFLNLTSLSYDDLEMKRVLNYLIMNSPNLRELTIKRFRPPSTQSLLESVTRPQSGCCLQRLKLFDIDGSLGTGVDLELVRFVLATAPLLLRIQIKPLHRLCSKLVIKFMKEVMQYKRVSREAVVIYDWNDEED